ncbi:hypothetical protein ACFWBM_15850 [Streptomyces sp. NPDC059980]|uniref:hypothetical protein n=1 Tax=Streptomyces sp. NPDC059980 TaxID=3347022 RepID=UPI00368089AE
MTDLVDFVIAQHGGARLWENAQTATAAVNVHGAFWPYKGQPNLLGVESVTADLRQQRITMHPFGEGNTLHFDAEQDLVTITDADGVTVDKLSSPRTSMAGYQGDTPWSATQMGYFISYATWTYLAEPFLFTLPGMECEEVEPWEEDGETWRRLQVTFPTPMASHSKQQTYYFDTATGMQRRLNYDVEVNGWAKVGHYTSEHKDFDGLTVPTRRRVLLRNEDNIADHTFCAILLDVDNVQLHA